MELRALLDMKKVHSFAIKWRDKFNTPNIDYAQLSVHIMGEECKVLDFITNSLDNFYKNYGEAIHNYEELEKYIDSINDIKLLGSAIYSRWRYFNYWAYSPKEILEPENRLWFITAFNRLAFLTEENAFLFKGEAMNLRIVSTNTTYFPAPMDSDEIEQSLIINANGDVDFSSLIYGDEIEYQEGRNISLNIGKLMQVKY